MTIATIRQEHRLAGVLTIDHVAVPKAWGTTAVEHHPVDPRLSDHDVYFVQVKKP